MDYSTWTLEDLQKRFVEAGFQYTVLANERQAILEEMEARKTRSEAVTRFSALSDRDNDALRNLLDVEAGVSVESK